MTQPGSPSATASASHSMVLEREHTALIVIDVQERLFPAMDSDHREEVMRNLKVLAATAQRLQLPTLATEQYPKGLGHTLPEMKAALPNGLEPIEKVAFSCWGVEAFRSRLTASGARQVLLGGIEAHVCVLMSALDLHLAQPTLSWESRASLPRTLHNPNFALRFESLFSR